MLLTALWDVLFHVDAAVKEKVEWFQTRHECYAAVSLTLKPK